ncbi:hypothetical protein PUR71_05195, partial [Streptomyces sp. SP17BM10]|uniref:hypothetical protein n=1 Tax=Streptomyces sp. SP17BM10 TaxID=3002530 RepID=UPI002E7662F0
MERPDRRARRVTADPPVLRRPEHGSGRRTRIRARGGAIGDRFRRGTFAGLATGRANAFGALRLLLAATVVVSH